MDCPSCCQVSVSSAPAMIKKPLDTDLEDNAQEQGSKQEKGI